MTNSWTSLLGDEEKRPSLTDGGMDLILTLHKNWLVWIWADVRFEDEETAQAYVDFITDKFIPTGVALMKYFHVHQLDKVRNTLWVWVESCLDLLTQSDEEIKDILKSIGGIDVDGEDE